MNNHQKYLKSKKKCLECDRLISPQKELCLSCSKKGNRSRTWKGGFYYRNGYKYVYCPHHPKAIGGHIAEHRLIMEKHLCRFLTPKEIVHHINGIKDDNKIENLLLTNLSEHLSIHIKLIKKYYCKICKKKVISSSNHRKYCDKCSKLIHKKQSKQWRKSNPKRLKELKRNYYHKNKKLR